MPVRLYANESPVELFVNGNSLGSKPVHSATAVWEVHFSAGENVLSARSPTREDRMTVYYEDRGSLFAEVPSDGARLAVNAGAGEQFIDRRGLAWEADRPYSEGLWGHVGGTSERSHRRILDTDDDPLYQARRVGAHSYRFDVADGSYRMGLRLAALDGGAAIDAFRVIINGVPAQIPRLIPFSPRSVEWLTEASDGQGVTVVFPAEAFVNGVLLEPVAPGEGSN
jgi:beta-galactosidase